MWDPVWGLCFLRSLESRCDRFTGLQRGRYMCPLPTMACHTHCRPKSLGERKGQVRAQAARWGSQAAGCPIPTHHSRGWQGCSRGEGLYQDATGQGIPPPTATMLRSEGDGVPWVTKPCRRRVSWALGRQDWASGPYRPASARPVHTTSTGPQWQCPGWSPAKGRTLGPEFEASRLWPGRRAQKRPVPFALPNPPERLSM